MMKQVSAACLAATTAVVCLSANAWAGSKIVDYIDTTPTTIRGVIETNPAGNVDPFVVQVYAGNTGTECLVITDTAPLNFDTTATLVAPDGNVWYNDDGNGNLRPKIKAITSSRGWHVLTISTYSGFAGTADITFTYGRYPGSSSNCAGATPPVRNTLAAAVRKTPNSATALPQTAE